MRAPLLLLLFVAVWTWGHVWRMVALLRDRHQTEVRWGNLVGLGAMLVGGWVFTAILFLSEVRRAQRLLEEAVRIPDADDVPTWSDEDPHTGMRRDQ